MPNALGPYGFPDSYNDIVVASSSVKYVSAAGSNSNDGNTVTTPYLTIAQALSATSAISTSVTIVILGGTYTVTPGVATATADAIAGLSDNNLPRKFVCCPGQTTIQWTDSGGQRDSTMVDFRNAGSALYGAILLRNNNGRTTTYTVAFFNSSTAGTQRGSFYNCVFRETNANNAWSFQYDNSGTQSPKIYNTTFYVGAAPSADWSNSASLVMSDSVFNVANFTSPGTRTNVGYSATINATTYVATGITTQGVYSGTYSWTATNSNSGASGFVASYTGSPTVTNSGGYDIYKFTNSGIITFNASTAIKILVVAGGGGGLGGYPASAVPGGGAGGGGVVAHNSLTVTAQAYTVTVGAGGAYASTSTTPVVGNPGGDSIFGSNVIVAKGGGGSGFYGVGGNGGSGGGGGYNSAAGGTATQNTSGVNGGGTGYGYAGGTGTGISTGSAGGGGAGAVGANATSVNGAAGGIGFSSSITGTATYYAGGGGGAGSYSSGGTGTAGGLGGGATGGAAGVAAGSATINTGGGGASAPNSAAGSSGGSGVVIIAVLASQPPGLYASASTITSGSNVSFSLYSANTGNIPYTITGITSDIISNASLTGNFVMASGSSTVTFTVKSLLSSSYTMSMTADGSTANANLVPNVSISTSVIGIGSAANTAYLAKPVNGQMNIINTLVTVAQYDKGGSLQSAYPVSGQMNINQSVVSTTNAALGSQPLLPTFSNMQSNVSVPYTTMTNKIAGPIDQGIVKLFGDSPNRELWM